MTKKHFVSVKINHEALAKANGVAVGDTIRVEVCPRGTPKSQYWRNRFKDLEAEKDSLKTISVTKPVKQKANKES